jgi:ketosteroid isomerase-like protein
MPRSRVRSSSAGDRGRVMSQENVEIVRGVYDAFARRDNDAPFAVYAPDIELDFREAGLDGIVYHGHEGVRAAFRTWLAPFREFQFQPEEMRDCGDHVLATVHDRGIGRSSGVVVERRHYALWTVRGGKIVSLRLYMDRAEALEAAGLRE